MQSQQGLQEVLDAAVAAGDAPFLIAMVGNSDGVIWSGVAGDCAPGRAASLDTIFRLYSQTKAVCATAAMILVDRGKLDIDAPVEDLLPEIGALQVLEGFDGTVPRLRAPRRKITARHLATHTSGLSYETGHTLLEEYFRVTGQPSYFSGLREGLKHPLIFDPGEGWAYGIGLDWMGFLIERIDGRSIETFCKEEVFEPLGMVDTCFEPNAEQDTRLCRLYVRGADGAFEDRDAHIVHTGRPDDQERHERTDYHGMGGCLYGTAPDYMRLLRMHLAGGILEGNRIVSEATVRRLQGNLVGEIPSQSGWFPGPRKGHALAVHAGGGRHPRHARGRLGLLGRRRQQPLLDRLRERSGRGLRHAQRTVHRAEVHGQIRTIRASDL